MVIPAPSAEASVGLGTFAIVIFLSSTAKSTVLIVVVVPSTVRFPATVRSPPVRTVLSGFPS